MLTGYVPWQYHITVTRSSPHGYVVELNGSFLEVDARPMLDGGKLVSVGGVLRVLCWR